MALNLPQGLGRGAEDYVTLYCWLTGQWSLCDHSLLTPNLPFKLILRRFEFASWCLIWECCTFWKDWWWKWHKINQYSTCIMALIRFGRFLGVFIWWVSSMTKFYQQRKSLLRTAVHWYIRHPCLNSTLPLKLLQPFIFFCLHYYETFRSPNLALNLP